MLEGYENYEKLKDNAFGTKRAVMNCTSALDLIALSHTGEENFSTLQTENTGNFLCARKQVFISKCSAEIGL